MAARSVSCVVTFAGQTLTDVISARGEVVADAGWPTCSVFVTRRPIHDSGEHEGEPIGEDNTLVVTAGAGNNVVRFTGPVRRFRSSSFPRSIELVATGSLAYANEWAPNEDIVFEDEFPSGATDAQLVAWALDHVPNITYVGGNVTGTSTILGTEAPDAFDWQAGTSAWIYIQQIDRATLYRTYQARDGTIYRSHMIGHPDSTPDFTLANADILDGATGGRDTERTRNNVRVLGHDYGQGPVSAELMAAPIPGTPDRWSEFQSSLIESGVDDTGTWDGAGGLRADQLAAQILPDIDKEFVEASVPSWRDDTHGPGMTCLLDCLDRLAIGEPMWVARHAWEVGDNGWITTYGLTGGGLPQTNPAPPI